MFFERTVRTTIENINATFPVLLVTGPRQVGKSTLLESMMEPGRKKVSLDNPTIRAMAISDPELFLQRYSPPVLIDEAQYAPELFPYIKILVDERKRPGDFWLTGSQMFRLNAGKRPPLYFYRDNNKKEIDLIIYQDGTVYPIEIKKGSAPKDAVKNFSVLSPIEAEPSEEDSFSGAAHLKTKIGTGAVVCLASDIIPIDRKNWYIPAWLI